MKLSKVAAEHCEVTCNKYFLDKNQHGDLYSAMRALSMCTPLIVPWAVHLRSNRPQHIHTFDMETGKFFLS